MDMNIGMSLGDTRKKNQEPRSKIQIKKSNKKKWEKMGKRKKAKDKIKDAKKIKRWKKIIPLYELSCRK